MAYTQRDQTTTNKNKIKTPANQGLEQELDHAFSFLLLTSVSPHTLADCLFSLVRI